jgi:hypothetical protein
MAAIEVELDDIAILSGDAIWGKDVAGRANIDDDGIGESAGSECKKRDGLDLNHDDGMYINMGEYMQRMLVRNTKKQTKRFSTMMRRKEQV